MSTATESGTFLIGGRTPVRRLGYGSMQLTGPGVWGPPSDPDEAIRVLRLAVDLGVQFIDTADSYGPAIAEALIRHALHPYPDGLIVATKAGLTRPGPGGWVPKGDPGYLRHQVDASLERLGLERLPLFQLHRIDPAVPFEDQIGVLSDLKNEGKIDLVGLSQVSIDELDAASRIVDIASVQNLFNLGDQRDAALVDYAASRDVAFIPWFPLATGALAERQRAVADIARRHQALPSQIALAWLLRRSPTMIPIPGTSSQAHLRDNIAAATIHLSDDQFHLLSAPTVEARPR